MAAQSQGVYIETVVCTDRCGSNKGQPEDGKKPTWVHIFLLICFFLLWFDCIDIDAVTTPVKSRRQPPAIWTLSFPHPHSQPVLFLLDLPSICCGTRKLLRFFFAGMLVTHESTAPYFLLDNIIQAGLCLNRQTQSFNCSQEKLWFLSEPQSQVGAWTVYVHIHILSSWFRRKSLVKPL